jgi:hypothetical protein
MEVVVWHPDCNSLSCNCIPTYTLFIHRTAVKKSYKECSGKMPTFGSFEQGGVSLPSTCFTAAEELLSWQAIYLLCHIKGKAYFNYSVSDIAYLFRLL